MSSDARPRKLSRSRTRVIFVLSAFAAAALMIILLMKLGIARRAEDCSITKLESPQCLCEPCVSNGLDVAQLPTQTSASADFIHRDSQAFKWQVTFSKQDTARSEKHLSERRNWSAEDWEKETELVMSRNKKSRYNIVAVANIGHLNFTLNWVASLRHQLYTKFVIFCLDWRLYSELVEVGLASHLVLGPKTWVKYDIVPAEHKWMMPEYNRLTEAKLRIQLALLKLGYWLIFSDVDSVFLNPNIIDHLAYMMGRWCEPKSAPSQCWLADPPDLAHRTNTLTTFRLHGLFVHDRSRYRCKISLVSLLAYRADNRR
jgi:hypothetical protein